jgi:hypothetical protein
VYGKKKSKSKWDILVIVTLLSLSAGMGVAACGVDNPTGQDIQFTAVVTPTTTQVTATIGPDTVVISTSTPQGLPTIIVQATPCATPTSTLLSIDAELELHGVKFDDDMAQWTLERKTAVLEAVRAVNSKLANTVVGASFKAIYGYVNMTWGLKNATGQCASIAVGGCTSSRHQINFVTISDDPLRARNNVVHELGHAFSNFWSNSLANADRAHPENTHPAIVLGWTQGDFPAYTEYIIAGFPNRADPVKNAEGKYDAGDYLGFFSQQNVLTWQVAMTQAGSSTEEFADQFLGWTFDTWQPPDELNYGPMRRDWMDKYMPGWINRILRG